MPNDSIPQSPDFQEPAPKTPDIQNSAPPTPDPNGPPTSFLNRPLPSAVTIVLGGIAGLILLGIVATPTMGARHSTHLQWQQRNIQNTENQALPEIPQPQPAKEHSHD